MYKKEISLDEYHEGGHSVCRNPVLQKMFVFLGVGEKSGGGVDIIAKGWIENGWIMPSIEEKRILKEWRLFFV